MADKLERIYTIPLSKAYDYLRTRRTERAVKLLREFVLRHMKAEVVKISAGVNNLLWRDSIEKPPRKVKVRVVKDEGVAHVWLLGEEEELKKTQEEKKKVAEAKKKEEEKKAKPATGAKEGDKQPKTGEKAPEAQKATDAQKQPVAHNPTAGEMKQKGADTKNVPVKPNTV